MLYDNWFYSSVLKLKNCFLYSKYIRIRQMFVKTQTFPYFLSLMWLENYILDSWLSNLISKHRANLSFGYFPKRKEKSQWAYDENLPLMVYAFKVFYLIDNFSDITIAILNSSIASHIVIAFPTIAIAIVVAFFFYKAIAKTIAKLEEQ